MKDWFDPDGHVTDDALDALLNENLDELSRLEISEHLSFCDDCLLRYTERLSDDRLEAPPASVAPGVMAKLRRASIAFFCNKYVTMTIGAAAAIALWISGAFSTFDNTNLSKFITHIETTSGTLAQGTIRFSDSISEAISGLFESMNTKGTDSYEKK